MTTVDKQRLLMKLLHERGQAVGPRIAPVPPGTAVPLNSAQARIWFFCQQYPNSTEYNMPELRVVARALDAGTLTAAVAELMRRHDALRLLMFERQGVPMQQDHGRIDPPVTWHDLRHLPADAAEARAIELSNQNAQSAFSVDEPYLFQVIGFGLPGDRTLLALNFHHLNIDGLSRMQAVAELDALLHGRTLDPPAPVGFLDYVAWEAERADEATMERELAYWLDKLAGDLPVLDLPRDRPRPSESSRDGHTVPVSIPGPLLVRLQQLAADEGVTVYVVLLAAYKLFLARLGRQRDVIVGTPLAGRDHEVTETILGCFVKSVPLRTSLDGDPTFRELVRRERETVVGALDNQTVPFDRVVAELAPPRLPGVTPVFQTMVNLLSGPEGAEDTGDLGVELETNSSQRELSLSLSTDGDGLGGLFIYSADIFDRETMQRFVTVFETLLAAAADQPDARAFELSLLQPAERERILHGLNPYRRPETGHLTMAQPFEEQARRTPEAVAVHGADGPVTYADLDARANRLARHLRGMGVRAGDAVGVCAGRGADQIVALYAAAKLGAPSLTVDPGLPADQIEPMLDDAAPVVVIAEAAAAPRVPAGPWRLLSLADAGTWADTSADDIPVQDGGGYGRLDLRYTATTDGPAAVVHPVAAALARLDALQRAHPIGPGDAVLATTPAGAPAPVEEVYWPLSQGATLAAAADPRSVLEAVDAHGVTTLLTSPAGLTALLQADGSGAGGSLRHVFCDGEPVSAGLRDRFQARFPGELITGYAPFETGRVTDAVVPAGTGTPALLGRPAAHVNVYVLDEALAPTPIGVPGELYIGGEIGLPEAYHRAPALTATRLLADPFGAPGARMFRTGDLGRYRGDGVLEYLGPLDRQATVHGMRVDLAEVEAAFTDQDGVWRAVVTAAPGHPDELAAFVVPAPGREPSAADLLDGAARRLPQHLVPAGVTVLDAIPEALGGGIDLEALLDLAGDGGGAAPAEPAGAVAPATPLEAGLAEIFARLLRRDTVGVTDSFFTMGGHSLLVFKLIEECAAELGVRPTVQDVFTSPSVRELAATLQTAQAELRDEDNLVSLVENQGAPLLVLVHAASGSVLPFYEVAQCLGDQFAVYALQSLPDDPPASIEDIAAVYVDAVDEVRGVAPVVLAGWSMGGCVAVEMARCWLDRDEPVAATLLIDTWAPPAFMSDAAEAAQVRESILALDVLRLEGVDAEAGALADLTAMVERNRAAFLDYRPQPYPAELDVLRASDPLPPDARPFPAGYLDGDRGWAAVAARVETAEISGSHLTLFDEAHADALAEAISAAVARRMYYEEI
ncbi:MAG TPA: alpha/beta fold hydrolase [Streptosporangiaceae bacterium]|nr:alpha/beta fold hydrolase [Streptosporangiaceae bacterium]